MNELKEKITADDLESKTADQRIDWVIKSFPKQIFMSTSFGIQSAVMLHMITKKYLLFLLFLSILDIYFLKHMNLQIH